MNIRTALAATATAATAVTTLLAGNASAAPVLKGHPVAAHARTAPSGTAHAAVNDGWGCPSGYVCIIAFDTFTIVNKYYTYGAHNLSGKYGDYLVDNNQTDGARVVMCYGYNGVNCTGDVIPAGETYRENLTPINSVKLYP